jgi:CRISPR type I-E-associated protein CasB/Cse2
MTTNILKAHALIHAQPRTSAVMRRASTTNQLLFERKTHEVLRLIKDETYRNEASILEGIRLLAFLKLHQPGTLGSRLRDETVNESRVKQLLFTKERSDASEEIRRLLPLLKNTADAEDLFSSIYWWNEKTTKKIAQDYYTENKK